MEGKEIYVADFVYGIPSLNRVRVTEEGSYYRTTTLASVHTYLGCRFEAIYFSQGATTVRLTTCDFDEARRWLDERILSCIAAMQEKVVTLAEERVSLAKVMPHDAQKERS